jgi:hypothetical protein
LVSYGWLDLIVMSAIDLLPLGAYSRAPTVGQVIAGQFMGTDGTKLVDDRIVRGDRTGIAPVPVHRELLRGERSASHFKEFGCGVDDELGDDRLRLRRSKLRSIELLRLLFSSIERSRQFIHRGENRCARSKRRRRKSADNLLD